MNKLAYEAPALREVACLSLEAFCTSGGTTAPDYDPIDDFDWGNN